MFLRVLPPLHRRGGAKTWQSSSIHILLSLTQRDENGGDSCDQASSPPQKKKLQKCHDGDLWTGSDCQKRVKWVFHRFFEGSWMWRWDQFVSAIKCSHFQSFMFSCEQNRRQYSFTKREIWLNLLNCAPIITWSKYNFKFSSRDSIFFLGGLHN